MNRGRKGVAVLAVLGAWAACGDSRPTLDAGSACGDPTRLSLPSCPTEDPFSDESCGALDDRVSSRRFTVDDARAPAVTSPAEAERIPVAAPYTFRWTEPMVRFRARGGLVASLGRWLTLVPEAHAHCPPFNGRGYELSFKVAGQVVYRRQQSGTAWTPAPSQWAQLRAALGAMPTELTVYTAVFSNSQIASGNGPYTASAPRRFQLAP